MRKLNTLELFAGCGGLMDGFEKSGKYNTLACVEWKEYACDTLVNRLKRKYNYHDAEDRVLHFDINRTFELVNGWENDEVFGSNNGLNHIINSSDIDLIIGGLPCQPYAVAGRMQDKTRNYLFESYLKVVRIYNPKLIIFENVKGMLTARSDGERIVDKIKKDFNEYGFDIIDDISGQALIDLSEFGIPQKRKRIILVGLNRRYFGDKENQEILQYFYNNILESYKSESVSTVRDAIADLPKLLPSESDYRVGNREFSHNLSKKDINWHIPRYHSRRDIKIFRIIADDVATGQNNYQSTESFKKLYTDITGKMSIIHKYYVLRWDQPSNAILSRGHSHIHPDPEQARSISVREAARLQTFDDDFEFIGSMVRNYEIIGHSTPPEFARRLAFAIHDLLEEKGMT